MTILLVESSARKAGSATRAIAAELVSRLVSATPAKVVTRDLGREPVPHVTDESVTAMFIPAEDRAPAAQTALALSEELIGELEAARALVLAVPMYNYSVPSALKAWIDHIVRARRTFRHTPEGPVGLLEDKPVYIVTASGGIYSAGPGQTVDYIRPYLRAVLSKIGLKSLTFIAAEGQAVEAVGADVALAGALTSLDDLLPRATPARSNATT